jgi:hypothetical protein
MVNTFKVDQAMGDGLTPRDDGKHHLSLKCNDMYSLDSLQLVVDLKRRRGEG